MRILVDSQLTPSEIAKKVGVNYANAAKHLEALEAEGILAKTSFGKRIRFYKYNEASAVAVALLKLIEAFES